MIELTVLSADTLKLSVVPDLSLLVPCYRVNKFGEDLSVLCQKMHRIMNHNNGIGLAATQVGYNLAVFILSTDLKMPVGSLNTAAVFDQSNRKLYYAIINPTILDKSSEMCDLIGGEGCLSVPNGPTGKVKRHREIKLKYQNINGIEVIETIDNLLATVIQHEFDHLIGVLYPARMDEYEALELLKVYAKKNKFPMSSVMKFYELTVANAKSAPFYLDFSKEELVAFGSIIGLDNVGYNLIRKRIEVINGQGI